MTKLISVCLVLFAVIYLVLSEDTKCAVPTLWLNHYEESNCTPVMDGDCPIRYECPDFKANDPEKCYVNGNTYDRGQQISKNDYNNPCAPECVCDDYSPVARVTCVHVDCPEVFGFYSIPLKFGEEPPVCIRQESADSCCITNQICEEEELAKLATCEYESKTYRGGEKIYPKTHPCHTCICNDGFDGRDIENNPHCTKFNCGVGIEQDKLRDGCSPIYYGTNRCCNIDWRCPNDDKDEVIKSEGRSGGVDDANTCIFGKLKLNIGDKLNRAQYSSDRVECKCIVPPLTHCIETPMSIPEPLLLEQIE